MPDPINVTAVQNTPFSPLPCPPSNYIRMVADFTSTLEFEAQFSSIINRGHIDSIQGMYVDNGGNANPVTFDWRDCGKRIVFPASSQGFLPLILSKQPRLVIAAAGGIVPFFLYNFAVPAEIWASP